MKTPRETACATERDRPNGKARENSGLTLMAELKAATQAAHVQLDGLPYFAALESGAVALESYVGHLRALAIIHGTLEHAIAGSQDRDLVQVWRDDMRRLPLLQTDLHFFEPRAVADIGESVDAALQIAGDISLRLASQPATLLGLLYVLEGSALGGQTIAPRAARAFALAAEGLDYLHSGGGDGADGGAVRSRWAGFTQRMNGLQLSGDERTRIVGAAAAFFAAIKKVFAALQPFQAGSLAQLVTSINPEAGRHPIPADPREVGAALRAAAQCWEKYPYFEMRYGERGRRFTDSDGAWLATLCRFEPARISQQVKWLGRVLSTRGMPSMLLQSKLELLCEELIAAVPERKADYEKLALAAAELRAVRRSHVSDGRLAALAGAFDHAAGPEWSGKLPHSGELLVCAVADELAGNTGTVEKLRSWMTDSARFPAHWIAAVEATLHSTMEHTGST